MLPQAGFITDNTIRKDNNTWCEVLAQCLEMSSTSCQEKGLRWPAKLVVQCDNASDNRNQFNFLYAMALVAVGRFKEVRIQFLRAGHTHEDIDQMFGRWASCLLRQPTLQTPFDFVRVLGQAFPDTRFSKLDYVRPWRAFFRPLGIQFTGMFGSRRSPHVYSFQPRCCAAA